MIKLLNNTAVYEKMLNVSSKFANMSLDIYHSLKEDLDVHLAHFIRLLCKEALFGPRKPREREQLRLHSYPWYLCSKSFKPLIEFP